MITVARDLARPRADSCHRLPRAGNASGTSRHARSCTATTRGASAERGVGFLLHEGGLPIRLRSYYLADEQLESIAARAEALRRQVSGEPENGGV